MNGFVLFKPEALRSIKQPDFVRLRDGTEFFVGYGLDYQGRYRTSRHRDRQQPELKAPPKQPSGTRRQLGEEQSLKKIRTASCSPKAQAEPAATYQALLLFSRRDSSRNPTADALEEISPARRT